MREYKNLIKDASRLLKNNCYQEAILKYSKAIELNSEADTAYYNRALINKRLGRDEQALKDFKKTIKLDPEKSKAYYNLINSLTDGTKYGQYIKAGLKNDKHQLALATDFFTGFDDTKEDKLYYYTSLQDLKSILENKEIDLRKVDFLNDEIVKNRMVDLLKNLQDKLADEDLNVKNKIQFFKEIALHVEEIFADDFDRCSYIEEFIARVGLDINEKIAGKIRKSFNNNFNKFYFNIFLFYFYY